MTYPELTPGQMGRYDGYMDPSAESAANRAPNPAPLSEAARSLLESQAGRGETDVAPAVAEQNQVAQEAKTAQQKIPNIPTREYLVNLSRDILTNTSPSNVVGQYRLVKGWADLIKKGLPPLEQERFQSIL